MQSSEDDARVLKQLPVYDYAAVFEKTPGLYLILDTSFNIVAANDAYCEATRRTRESIVGRQMFEVFIDGARGVAPGLVERLRASLLRVLKSRKPDRMEIQRADARAPGGGDEIRYWSPLNIPVLGSDGYVKWIIHCVEDVTGIEDLRGEFAANRGLAAAQRLLARLHKTERDLALARGEGLRDTLAAQAQG